MATVHGCDDPPGQSPTNTRCLRDFLVATSGRWLPQHPGGVLPETGLAFRAVFRWQHDPYGEIRRDASWQYMQLLWINAVFVYFLHIYIYIYAVNAVFLCAKICRVFRVERPNGDFVFPLQDRYKALREVTLSTGPTVQDARFQEPGQEPHGMEDGEDEPAEIEPIPKPVRPGVPPGV